MKGKDKIIQSYLLHLVKTISWKVPRPYLSHIEPVIDTHTFHTYAWYWTMKIYDFLCCYGQTHSYGHVHTRRYLLILLELTISSVCLNKCRSGYAMITRSYHQIRLSASGLFFLAAFICQLGLGLVTTIWFIISAFRGAAKWAALYTSVCKGKEEHSN